MKHTNKKPTPKLNSPSPRAQTYKGSYSPDNEEVKYDQSPSYQLYLLPDLDDTIFAHIGEFLDKRDGQLVFTHPDICLPDGTQPYWFVKQFNHVLMVGEWKTETSFPEEFLPSITGKPVTRLSVTRTGEDSVNVNAYEIRPLSENEVSDDLLPWEQIIPEVKP